MIQSKEELVVKEFVEALMSSVVSDTAAGKLQLETFTNSHIYNTKCKVNVKGYGRVTLYFSLGCHTHPVNTLSVSRFLTIRTPVDVKVVDKPLLQKEFLKSVDKLVATYKELQQYAERAAELQLQADLADNNFFSRLLKFFW